MTIRLLPGTYGLELYQETGNWILKAGYGYSPVEILVASVGACGAYVYESIMNRSQVDYEIIHVWLDYTIDETISAKPLETISVIYEMKVVEQDRARVERMMDMIPQYCPVMISLHPKITVSERVKFL